MDIKAKEVLIIIKVFLCLILFFSVTKARQLNAMKVKIFWICACLLVLTDRPPPIILQGPINQTLAVDGTALLKCKATGEPLPVISWLKEGFTFLGRDPRATIQDQGTLQIKNLRVRSGWHVAESIPSTLCL